MKNRLNGINDTPEDGSDNKKQKKRYRKLRGNTPFEQPGSEYFKKELATRQILQKKEFVNEITRGDAQTRGLITVGMKQA
jgi:hypothetical protein